MYVNMKCQDDDTLRPKIYIMSPILAVITASRLVRFVSKSEECRRASDQIILLLQLHVSLVARPLSCTVQSSLSIDEWMFLSLLTESTFILLPYSKLTSESRSQELQIVSYCPLFYSPKKFCFVLFSQVILAPFLAKVSVIQLRFITKKQKKLLKILVIVISTSGAMNRSDVSFANSLCCLNVKKITIK